MENKQTSLFSLNDILNFEQHYRAAFINSLSGFKSLALIATIDANGKSNVAIFNSVIHIGAHPPLMGFISRPDSAERHTLLNIKETGVYTINHVNQSIYQAAHQTAARYSKEISEFTVTGLTEEYKNNFSAPFVKESNIQIALKFKEQINISSNGTILIIGEIQQVFIPANCISTDGFVDIEKAKSITGSGLDSYHTTQRIARLSYAKPNKAIEKVISQFNHE